MVASLTLVKTHYKNRICSDKSHRVKHRVHTGATPWGAAKHLNTCTGTPCVRSHQGTGAQDTRGAPCVLTREQGAEDTCTGPHVCSPGNRAPRTHILGNRTICGRVCFHYSHAVSPTRNQVNPRDQPQRPGPPTATLPTPTCQPLGFAKVRATLMLESEYFLTAYCVLKLQLPLSPPLY